MVGYSSINRYKMAQLRATMTRLNMAVVRPTTTDHLTAVSERLKKLRHILLHAPALTEILCLSRINVTYYSAVTMDAQSR
jgi:hypothetical protein